MYRKSSIIIHLLWLLLFPIVQSDIFLENNYLFDCKPIIEFQNCLPLKSSRNPMWNIRSDVAHTVILNVQSTCSNSAFFIRWILVEKETGRVALNMKEFNNKHIIIFPPKTLAPKSYILIARVRESSFMSNGERMEVKCWINVIADIVKLEFRASRTIANFGMVLETNVAAEGWEYCSNPNMDIYFYVKPEAISNINAFYYFENPASFDNWGQDLDLDQFSSSVESNDTNGELQNNSPKRHYLINRKGLVIGIVNHAILNYGSKKQFRICGENARTTRDCEEGETVKTCLNFANSLTYDLESINTVKTTPTTLLKFLYNSRKSITLPTYLKVGVFVMDDLSLSRRELMIAYGDQNVTLALRLWPSFHQISFIPLDYSTFVTYGILPSTASSFMRDGFSVTTIRVSSLLVGTATNADHLKTLKDLQDGEIGGTHSLQKLITERKFQEAIQMSHILLMESKRIVLMDSDRNYFVSNIMGHLSKNVDWDFPDIELVWGLLPRFDMKYISNEIFYSRNKALLMYTVTEALRHIAVSHKYPMTMQHVVDLLFKRFLKRVVRLFDSDFVKPFTFDVEVSGNVFCHFSLLEEYENYNGYFDEGSKDDFSVVNDKGLKALESLLFARARTYFHKHLFLYYLENKATGKIYIENGDTWQNYMDGIINNMIRIEHPFFDLKQNQELRFMWSLLDQNMFFWSSEGKNLHTPMFFFQYYIDNAIARQDVKTVIAIELIGSLTVPLRIEGAAVPLDTEHWTSELMSRIMRVYKVRPKPKYTFLLFLDNITTVDKLRIVVKQEKPVLSDFSNPKVDVVVFDNTTTSLVLPVVTLTYFYVAILPFKDDVDAVHAKSERRVRRGSNIGLKKFGVQSLRQGRVKLLPINYAIAFAAYACPSWTNKSFSYKNCEVLSTSTPNKASCACQQIGVPISFSIQTLSFKAYGVLDIGIKLVLVIEYVIVICTAIAVFLFCCLWSFAPWRALPSPELVFFLADNERASRFGYLIKVKTNDVSRSGTDAIVGIRIYGIESNSKKHILNYPDPENKLLQSGNVDHFLLATDEPLGDIRFIELWTDCSGHSPNWFCESVHVYDIQTDEDWFFNVQKRFHATETDFHERYYPDNPHHIRIRKPWHYFTFHWGPTNAWNILNSSQDIFWSYGERLSVMLSQVLCTCALTLYLIHPPEHKLTDGISEPYQSRFTLLKNALIVTAIVSPVNGILGFGLRMIKRQGRIRGIHGHLPPGFRYILWLILLWLIMASLYYCLVYGPFIGYTTSHDWPIIVFVSLIFNIFLFENFYLAIHEMWHLSIYRLYQKDRAFSEIYNQIDIIEDIEEQRKFLFMRIGGTGLRPHMKSLYTKLTGEILTRRIEENIAHEQLHRVLDTMMDAWMFAVFFTLLTYFERDNRAVHLTTHLEHMFVEGRFGEIQFGIHEVYTFTDIYKYLNESFVKAVTPSSWYDPYRANDVGLLKDFSSKYLGAIRLRQKRVLPHTCPNIGFAALFRVSSCSPEYIVEELMNTSLRNGSDNMWRYYKDNKINYYHGIKRVYDGNGYAINLGKTRSNAYYRINLIKQGNWLDRYTSAFIIEMLVYNANANLFTDIKLVFERSGQYLYPSARVYSMTLMPAEDKNHQIKVVVIIINTILGIRLAFIVIERILLQRRKFLTDAFSLGLLVLMILKIIDIIIVHIKEELLDHLLQSLKQVERNQYISYSQVVHFHLIEETFHYVKLFVGTTLLLHYMKYFDWTHPAKWALDVGMPTFIYIGIHIFNTLLCVTLVGYVLFGGHLEEFLSPADVFVLFLQSSFRMNSRNVWVKLWTQENLLARVIYVCCLLIVNIFGVYCFVVSIRLLNESKRRVVRYTYGKTIRNYIGNLAKSFKLSIIRRFRRTKNSFLRGGTDYGHNKNSTTQLIFPHVDKYRYRNSIVVSNKTRRQINLVVLAMLKNRWLRTQFTRPDDEDFSLMRRIIKFHLAEEKDSFQIFLTRRVIGRRRTILIPDHKIEQMARISEMLLKSGVDDAGTEDAGPRSSQYADALPGTSTETLRTRTVKFQVDVENDNKMNTWQLSKILVMMECTNTILDSAADCLFGENIFLNSDSDECCFDD